MKIYTTKDTTEGGKINILYKKMGIGLPLQKKLLLSKMMNR